MSKSKVKVGKWEVEPLDEPLYLAQSHCKYVINQIKEYLMGKMLTIIDASIADKEQREAIKDLVKQATWSEERFSDDIQSIWIQFVEKYAPEIKTEKTKEYFDMTVQRVADRSWFSEKE